MTHAAKLPGGKPPLSMPQFELILIYSPPMYNLGTRLKVRIACLELEAKDRAGSEEVEFQLSCRTLDADTALQI